MKKTIQYIILLLLISNNLIAQNYKYDGASGTFGIDNNRYYSDMYCQMLISVQPGKEIKLRFIDFSTELNYDFVTVYDGATTSDLVIGTFSGNNIPPCLYSSGSQLLVVFSTDDSVVKDGWHAVYNSYDEIITTETGQAKLIYSNYLGGVEEHSILIENKDAAAYKLNFASLNIEQNDALVCIFDGDSYSNTVIGCCSGNVIPDELISSSSSMFLSFSFDGYEHNPYYTGYVASFSTIPASFSFTYDAAGNCTSRPVITLGASKSAKMTYNMPSDENKPNTDESNLNDGIYTLLPNPTKGEIELVINTQEEVITGTLALYNMSGSELQRITKVVKNNRLNLSDYPVGNYILKLTSNVGNREWKIIKE